MAAINNMNVVGSVDSAFMSLSNLVLMPEVRAAAPERYPVENLFDLAAFTDRLEKTGQTKYQWTEEDAILAEMVVESVSGTSGVGNAITITLEEASHADSGKISPPQPGDICLVDNSNGRFKFRIASVDKTTDDSHTITASKPGVNLVANIGAADVISILSNAQSDGSTMKDGYASLPLEFYNYTQIIQTPYRIDGSERANKSWRKIDGQMRYVIMQEKRAKKKHDLMVNYALLIGERTDDQVDATTGKVVHTTGGLEWFAKTYGNTDSYTTFALADMTGHEQTLNAEHVGNEVIFLQGSDLNISVNGVLRGLNDTTGINFSSFGSGDGKKRALDMGFDSYKLNSRTYHQKVINALNAKGATQSTNLPDEGFIIPADKFTNKAGKEEFKFKVRYKESDKENRFYKVWTRDQTITNTDQWELNMQSEVGFQGFCGNEFIAVTK
jgi:hypothetical protein